MAFLTAGSSKFPLNSTKKRYSHGLFGRGVDMILVKLSPLNAKWDNIVYKLPHS